MTAMDNQHYSDKYVLVVDDFANVRKSIKAQLHDLGINTVVEANDAVSASKTLRDYRFDLILCDLNLGKGKDGGRLLEEWRLTKAIGQETVFVLITAETSREMVVSAMEYSPDDYLAKPFSMDVLSNRLARWFERRHIMYPLLDALERADWAAVNQQARRVMESHPRHRSSAQKYFAKSLVQQGQLMEAEHFLRGLIDKRYLGWAQAEIHHIEFLQNKLESAERGLKEVLLRDPNLIEAYDLLAQTLQAQNKHEDLQEWLEHAVMRAPQNIKRQKALAKTAQQNEDYRRASVALRDIINASIDTMHENVSDYQHYMNNLMLEGSNTDNEQRKRDLRREIASASRKMTERYHGDANARLFPKALAFLEHENPASALHEKPLNEFLNSVFKSVDELNGETAILCAQVMYNAERLSDGDELVKQFRKRFAQQPDVLQRLNDLQAEPVSKENRQKARNLNLKGIELYKAKRFADSIHYFQEAMLLSPRHPGIILNFVQSHMVEMRGQGVNEQNIKLCLEYLSRLHYLPEDHYQYERYQKLVQNLEKMK